MARVRIQQKWVQNTMVSGRMGSIMEWARLCGLMDHIIRVNGAIAEKMVEVNLLEKVVLFLMENG